MNVSLLSLPCAFSVNGVRGEGKVTARPIKKATGSFCLFLCLVVCDVVGFGVQHGKRGARKVFVQVSL